MKCQHKTLRHRKPTLFGDGTTIDVEVRICVGCGEWLGMGEANDGLVEARIEAFAALLATGCSMTHAERAGWLGDETVPYAYGSHWHTGWLARVIADHDNEIFDASIARLEAALPDVGADHEPAPDWQPKVWAELGIAPPDAIPDRTAEDVGQFGDVLDRIPQGEPDLLPDEPLTAIPTTESESEATGAHEKFDVGDCEE